ncbi:hypothetical protein P885DRAFT_60495 [Corynascus similis CBS 632.67]
MYLILRCIAACLLSHTSPCADLFRLGEKAQTFLLRCNDRLGAWKRCGVGRTAGQKATEIFHCEASCADWAQQVSARVCNRAGSLAAPLPGPTALGNPAIARNPFLGVQPAYLRYPDGTNLYMPIMQQQQQQQQQHPHARCRRTVVVKSVAA